MAPKISGQFSIFDGVLFVFKSPLGMETKKAFKKNLFLPEKLGAILEHLCIECGLLNKTEVKFHALSLMLFLYSLYIEHSTSYKCSKDDPRSRRKWKILT